MEASSSSVRRRIGGRRPGDMFTSRRNTILVALGAAVLAGVLLFVFVQQYKKNVNSTAASTPVFVATALIPRGTAASEIASVGLYRRTLVKSNQALTGAIADASVLQGAVAATTIYPGQQLTAADFSHGAVTIASELTKTDRAISMPIDTTHGLVGFVSASDRVDVLSSIGGHVAMLAPNVLVLSAPASGGGTTAGSTNSGGNIVLRVSQAQIIGMAQAADNGKIWIVLRPPVGALAAPAKGTGG